MTTKETKLEVSNGRFVTVRIVEPQSYTTNPRNTNKGKQRGDAALGSSLSDSGLCRGIVAAKNRELPIGNHTYQKAVSESVVTSWVEIDIEDPTVGVVTRRMDWESANDPGAVRAAIDDNRTSELNYDLDAEHFIGALATLQASDFEIPPSIFTHDELTNIIEDWERGEPDEEPLEFDVRAGDGDKGGGDDRKFPLAILLTSQQKKRWDEIKEGYGLKSDTKAFLQLLEIGDD